MPGTATAPSLPPSLLLWQTDRANEAALTELRPLTLAQFSARWLDDVGAANTCVPDVYNVPECWNRSAVHVWADTVGRTVEPGVQYRRWWGNIRTLAKDWQQVSARDNGGYCSSDADQVMLCFLVWQIREKNFGRCLFCTHLPLATSVQVFQKNCKHSSSTSSSLILLSHLPWSSSPTYLDPPIPLTLIATLFLNIVLPELSDCLPDFGSWPKSESNLTCLSLCFD